MVFSNNLLMGAAGQSTGYDIDQSIRFNSGDSAYLTRTPGSAGNQRTFTLSTWVKFSTIKADNVLFSSWIASGPSAYALVYTQSGGELRFDDQNGTGIITNQVFGDLLAWYHVVLRVDTTDGTSGDRYQMYINGSRVTSFGTENQPAQNYQTNVNKAQPHYLGRNGYSLAMIYSDLYQAETHFIDGTALAASSFGETNADGVWIPKAYSGSYGTQGFYLKGQDSSALGDDSSGNGNDFTSSGLAAADQMSDSPTNNFWTFNPLDSGSTISDGNLKNGGGNSTNTHAPALPVSGKWYWEILCTDINTGTTGAHFFGICDASVFETQSFSDHAAISAGQQRGGQLKKNNSNTSTGTAVVDGNTVGFAFDADNLTLALYVDGSQSGSTITSLTAGTYKPWIQDGAAVTNMTINFGQSDFDQTVPTGYKSLCTNNMPTPTISDPSKYFQTTLYNGTGSELEVDQSGEESTFQPDFVWIKNRSNAGNENELYDAVRGATKAIFSSATSAESTQAQGLKSFDGDGFTVGTRGEVNTSGSTNVAWQWLANNTTGSTNDDGSVDSTVAVNTTAGFSIVKWVHTTSANYTVGHGLGATPKMILVKTLDQGTNWGVYHSDITVGNRLILNTNAAQGTGYWGANTWNSTVFSIGSVRDADSSNAIGYVFAEIPGYSSISSYTGNGSTNGPFVYTGFKPAFIIFKNISASSQDWELFDNKRDGLNDANRRLYPNTNGAEPSASDRVRLTSNGFKIVTSGGTHVNGSGNTIIYMAFAEHPFGGDGIAPATARQENKLMWKHNGRTIRVGKAWTADNGVQNPANWHIWSASEKVAAGVVEIAEESPPDSRLYNWSMGSDGKITKTAKSLADVNEVDGNGDPLLDGEGNQVVTRGVKWNLKQEVKNQQGALLAQTDWAIVRKADNGTAIPSNIQTWRNGIRTKATQMETAIDNATDTDAVAALSLTYTIESDDSVTKSGILYDWPELAD